MRYPYYRTVQFFVRMGMRSLWNVRIEGRENVPATGPCILAPNHQSALDPLMVQGACSRIVYTMTKSTQFSHPFFRWAISRGCGFPVRRYRVDPQAVRVLLRALDEGNAACVYPEGERSWDGRLGPFRRGAIRVLLRAGVPVVPVGVDGTYDIWPRWASRPRFGRELTLRFGEPIHFGQYRDRAEREAALPAAERRLREALLRLSGETARTTVRKEPATPESGRDGDVVPV